MILVKPTSGQTKIKVSGLYQWDQLRTLEFAKEYPSGTEVHFAIKGETVALVYLLENGAVRIPSVLLQRALPIMAWVNIGEATVLEIEMPVTQRSMPSDYIGIEDDVQHSIEYRTIKLEQWQVEAINQMSDRYTKVETDGKLKLKADANRVYTKLEVNTLLNAVDNGLADRYTKVEADTLLNEKADVNTVENGLTDRYTKAETNVLLNEKATVTELTDGLDERYTKDETNVLLNEKSTVTELTDGLDARYTKDETDDLLAEKANKQQEEWITPTLLNGWEEQVHTLKAKYYKDEFGIVHLEGCVKSGENASTLFILPSGYIPLSTCRFAASTGDNTAGRAEVRSTGEVTLHKGTSPYIYLSGISFRAEV